MKIIYCGMAPTSVTLFGKKTEVKREEIIELEENTAISLLNSYSNLFCSVLNKGRIKELLVMSEEKEEARQVLIDAEIKEKLIREETAKKTEIAILERKKVEKELSQKQEIKKAEREIEDIIKATKIAEDKKIELKLQMEEDKKEMDKRISKIQKTLTLK